MNIHRSGLAVEVKAPGFLEDLLAAEDQSAVGGQGEQQVKFLGPQVDALGFEPDFASGGIDEQVADMNGLGGA